MSDEDVRVEKTKDNNELANLLIELDKQEMNEKHLWSLTLNYDNLNEWKSIASLLNLSKQDIDLIEFNYLSARDGLRECFYQCLLKWRLIQPENCYFSYLSKLLVLKLNKTNRFILKLAKSMHVLLDENYNLFKNESISLLNYYIGILNKYNNKEINLNEFELSKVCAIFLWLSLKQTQAKFIFYFLKFKLNEKQMWIASDLMCLEWKSISRCLGVLESDIDDIQTKHINNDGIRECSYQSLLLWSQINSNYSNLEHLCLSLFNMRYNLFAKQLLEKLLFCWVLLFFVIVEMSYGVKFFFLE